MINKSNQEKLFSTFDSSVSKSNCIDSILTHSDTVYLHKVNFGAKMIGVFHHLVATGGTIYDSNSKQYGFIQGVGKHTVSMMTPDIDILSKVKSTTAIRVPTVNQLIAVKTVDDVNNLTASARTSYLPRNLVPIPPFLLSTIHEAISKSNENVYDVLLNCIDEIKNFDTLHAEEEDYDRAKVKCKDILFWLYLVATDSESIEATPTIGCNNESLIFKLQDITASCLSSPTAPQVDNILQQVEQSLKRPFEVLAASSSSTTDFMEKLTQLQNQSSEKSSKSFKKIPQKYQNMILVASSSSEVTCQDYDADGLEFFKSTNCINAQVMLNCLMESEGIECSVSSAVTATLLYGSFLWKDPLSPSGFAACVLSSEDSVFRSDTLHDGMILDYATKFEMSEASLTKLTKTQVLFPQDIDELSHRIRAIHVLASFFFKKNGFLSQGLKKVSNFVIDNK